MKTPLSIASPYKTRGAVPLTAPLIQHHPSLIYTVQIPVSFTAAKKNQCKRAKPRRLKRIATKMHKECRCYRIASNPKGLRLEAQGCDAGATLGTTPQSTFPSPVRNGRGARGEGIALTPSFRKIHRVPICKIRSH